MGVRFLVSEVPLYGWFLTIQPLFADIGSICDIGAICNGSNVTARELSCAAPCALSPPSVLMLQDTV